jgi:tetratricopeptide (TPR) repeat protein
MAYLKLKRYDEAMQAYTQAAQMSDQPGTAWLNVCALAYNLGQVDPGLAACDKAIAADPKLADAYFIKGSLLMGNASADAAGKLTAPPGTLESLQKYLQLQPDGPHAADARQMLDYLGVKTP